MEFLYVDVSLGATDLVATGDAINFALSVGAAPSGVPNISTTTTVATLRLLRQAGATESALLLKSPMRINLQDKNGFGFLVAADTLNVSGVSIGQAAAVVYNFRIYYRFVTVPISEYVGIVSSLMS